MNIPELLMPMSILGTIGTSVYFLAKVFTDYVLKKKMIERGYVNEDTQAVFRDGQTSKYSSLKWGLLFFCGGLSLIIMNSLGVDPESPLPYGIFVVGLSAGFLTYYAIVRKELK